MFLLSQKQNNIISLGYVTIWTILSFLIVYFFEVTISPRYEIYYGDCSVFKTIARAWTEGKIPYRDIFDHKGPYQYFINVLGLLISEKWGLYLLSAINLSIVTNILWAVCKLWLRPIQSIICICIFLGCYICVISGGNMTENWSLAFCVLPLFLFCRGTQKCNSKWWDNIIYGFCFGIIALIRINNGIIPASIILILFIKALREKQIGLALKQIALQLLGFFIAILPMIIYFESKGALDDMIYANYIFNMEYMLKWTTIADDNQDTVSKIYGNLRWLFPVLVLFVWSIWQMTRKSKDNSIAFMITVASGVTIIANIRSMNYLHYYIVFLPLILMLSIKTALLLNKNVLKDTVSKIMCALSVLWLVFIFIPSISGWALQLGKDVYKFGLLHCGRVNSDIENVTDMITRNVPTEQMNDIYNIGTYDGVAALLRLQTVPAGKYFFLQNKLRNVSYKVANEIDSYNMNASPAFIVIDKENIDTGNKSQNRMLDRYEVVDSANHSIYLLKLSHHLHD